MVSESEQMRMEKENVFPRKHGPSKVLGRSYFHLKLSCASEKQLGKEKKLVEALTFKESEMAKKI